MEKYLAKNGKAFTIRQPTENSAGNIINYLKVLVASTDQVFSTLQDLNIGIAGGRSFINDANRNPNMLILIAEIDYQIVGYLEFNAKSKTKISHTGSFIVNVHPDFQKIGIGSALIETLLSWAHQNSTIEKVGLKVIETNEVAIRIFKKLGFIEEGRHIKAIKQPSGEYADILQMYLWIK